MAKAEQKMIVVEQYGSAIRRPDHQRRILAGLGLAGIGKKATLVDTPETRGMIAKVAHMVRVVGE